MRRRTLLGATAVGLAGCPSGSGPEETAALVRLDVVNLHTEPHEVGVTVLEGEATVVEETVSIPAASMEDGMMRGRSRGVALPDATVPDFTVEATLDGGEPVRRLRAGDVDGSGEVGVELRVGASGDLGIGHSVGE